MERSDVGPVLVVEDDTDTRDLIERLLQARGARVITASSASEALRLLPSAKPETCVSRSEEIGDVLSPPTSGRRAFVTRSPARSTTLRLMSETPAPVSMAKTNGPAPLIHPLANNPRPRSSRRRIGAMLLLVCRAMGLAFSGR